MSDSPWTIQVPAPAAEVLAALPPEAQPGGSPQKRSLTFYDSFDWRLHNAGARLGHEQGPDGAWLIWHKPGADPAELRLPCETVPPFPAELPAGPLRDRLAALLDMRALLPMAAVVCRQWSLRALGEEDKTIAHVRVDEAALAGGGAELGCRIHVEPLRGYAREAKTMLRAIEAALGATGGPDDLALRAMKLAGHVPGSYSSKLAVRLERRQTALAAFADLFGALLASLLANEAGTRADTDSEFLHDFRVAVRRARSLVSAAKHVLPDDGGAFAGELRWLGAETTGLRDLDVFLLSFDELRAWLPAEDAAALDPLYAYLRREQRTTQARLVTVLASERYADLVRRWRAVSQDTRVDQAGPEAGLPVTAVARDLIWSAYRRLLRDGRAIDAQSPPEALHELRKRGKRLRYLVEAFGSLWPAPAVKAAIDDLKGLQDNLGRFQDRYVQAESLRGFAQALADGGEAGVPTLLAIGGLCVQLQRDGDKAREEFATRFAVFDAPAARRHYGDLFGSGKAAK